VDQTMLRDLQPARNLRQREGLVNRHDRQTLSPGAAVILAPAC
jgi:hypothetical protein